MPRFKGGILLIINIIIIFFTKYQDSLLLLLITLLIHEIGHIIAIYALGYKVEEIEFTIVGFYIKLSDNTYRLKDDLIIYSAGLVANLFLLLFPIIRIYSLVILIFNLLPIYPLDGYRIITALFSYKLPYKRVLTYLPLVSSIMLVLISFIMFSYFSILFLVNIIYLLAINIFNFIRRNRSFNLFKINRFLNKKVLKSKIITRLNSIDDIFYYYHNTSYLYKNKKITDYELLNLQYNKE